MLSLKVSLHISHLSTALKLLLTYNNTPPAPCPSDLWFSRSFLNNLYPSRASSLSDISGFVHDSVISIISIISDYVFRLVIYIQLQLRSFLHTYNASYICIGPTYILRPYSLRCLSIIVCIIIIILPDSV